MQALTSIGKAPQLSSAQRVMLGWYTPLLAAIEEELRGIEAREPRTDRRVYGACRVAGHSCGLCVVLILCVVVQPPICS